MDESSTKNKAYRIVNSQDVDTRTPRMVNTLVLGNIRYNHCGPTVLITKYADHNDKDDNICARELLWIKGQSDDTLCPVRDGNLTNRGFAQREMKLLQSVFSGEGLNHHPLPLLSPSPPPPPPAFASPIVGWLLHWCPLFAFVIACHHAIVNTLVAGRFCS
jgi:hypothetical protein